MEICDKCETVAHCSKHGCVPKKDFWEGYMPEHDLQAELDATNRQVEILSDALAESRREIVAFVKTVPDAITREDREHPEYMSGWNDCRAAMLKGIKP